MSQRMMWFAGTLVCSWATLFLVADPSQAAGHGGGHGGGGHGGGGFHGGGFHGGGFHGGGFHRGGFHGGSFHRGGFHNGGWGGHRGYYGHGYGGYWGGHRGYWGGYYPGWYGLWGYPYYSYGYAGYPYYGYGDWAYPSYSDSYYDSNYYAPLSGSGISPTYGTYAPLASTDNTAHLTVRVAPDAQVWFENTPTTQRGAKRQFQSPQLSPGTDYTYDIRARWRENGQDMEQTRHVTVYAGSQVTVDFTAPPPDQQQTPLSAGTSS